MSIRTSVAAFASLAVLLLLPAAAAAQSNEPSHAAMYVEAGGSGLLYSVNYEARLVGMVNGRIGFMAVNQPVNDGTSQIDVGVLLVPVMANVLVGSGSHRLELGAGPLLGVAGITFRRGATGQRAERSLQPAQQRQHTANDLAGDVLITLRHREFVEDLAQCVNGSR